MRFCCNQQVAARHGLGCLRDDSKSVGGVLLRRAAGPFDHRRETACHIDAARAGNRRSQLVAEVGPRPDRYGHPRTVARALQGTLPRLARDDLVTHSRTEWPISRRPSWSRHHGELTRRGVGATKCGVAPYRRAGASLRGSPWPGTPTTDPIARRRLARESLSHWSLVATWDALISSRLLAAKLMAARIASASPPSWYSRPDS